MKFILPAAAAAAATALSAAIILACAPGARASLACVLPFLFAAVIAPPVAATAPGNFRRGLVIFASAILGFFAGALATMPAPETLTALLMAAAFALLIFGVAALLSSLTAPAPAAVIASFLSFACLASPFLLGPLLKECSPTMRKALLFVLYWLNPMALATHSCLGYNFFRIRSGPVAIYGLGVSDYVYPYPAWWAAAILHSIAGGAFVALSTFLARRRGRKEEPLAA